MKSKRRKRLQAGRQRARARLQRKKVGRKSQYQRKWEYLHANGGWGFEYDDKPWK